MFYPFRLAVNESKQVNLRWDADNITVQNLTQYTLLIRIGSDSVPTATTDADLIVPPLGMQAIPTEGQLFAFKLAASPALSNPPPGLPSTCLVTLTRDERPPAFATAELASIYLATEQQLIHDQPIRAPGNYLDGPYDVPSNMRTLYLSLAGSNITSLIVAGVQSGINYILANPSAYASVLDTQLPVFITPWFAAIDAQVTVTIVSSGPSNGYQLFAGAEYESGKTVVRDKRQMVEVRPPGSSTLPISGSVAITGTPAVTISGQPVSVTFPAAQQVTFPSAQPVSISGTPAVTIPTPVPVTSSAPLDVSAATVATTRERIQRVTYLPSQVRNGAGFFFGAGIDMQGCTGITFMVQVTAIPGAGTITPVIYTPASNAAVWAATAALGLAIQEYLYTFYPGNAGAASGRIIEKLPIPFGDGWTFGLQHSAAGNWTYTVWYWLHP